MRITTPVPDIVHSISGMADDRSKQHIQETDQRDRKKDQHT
jgi:hypothetical protein